MKNPTKKRLGEQLPVHSPDLGSWQRLSAKLDALDADADLAKKLEKLPVHKPDPDSWNIILRRLNRAAYYKIGIRAALSAAAGLLLFFTVSNISESYFKTPAAPTFSEKVKPEPPQTLTAIEQPTLHKNTSSQSVASPSILVSADKKATSEKSVKQEKKPIEPQVQDLNLDNGRDIAVNTPQPVEDVTGIQNMNESQLTAQAQEEKTAVSDSEPVRSIMFDKADYASVTPPKKYYTPDEPSKSGHNSFGLAMNYLPENIENGTDVSLFHNLDLTASYNKEKVRFNTSLGMAYNEEQIEFEMNYNIKTPVMAVGPDGGMDTIRYDVSMLESQYQGTEKHQYFTYNLGFGRKLFGKGNFSSWISAGAGFGLKLNDPDIISSTEKNLQNMYNAQITTVRESQPVYNDVNVNFVTGIDFNYKFFNRLSLTFTPTSRWYFKPVITINNQPTDELTLGFKTGMKFEF